MRRGSGGSGGTTGQPWFSILMLMAIVAIAEAMVLNLLQLFLSFTWLVAESSAWTVRCDFRTLSQEGVTRHNHHSHSCNIFALRFLTGSIEEVSVKTGLGQAFLGEIGPLRHPPHGCF